MVLGSIPEKKKVVKKPLTYLGVETAENLNPRRAGESLGPVTFLCKALGPIREPHKRDLIICNSKSGASKLFVKKVQTISIWGLAKGFPGPSLQSESSRGEHGSKW